MTTNNDKFNLREHCHVNQNTDSDHFVGVKTDSNNSMIYFPIGYQLPIQDNELRQDIRQLFNILSRFTDKSDSFFPKQKFSDTESVNFPFHAYYNIINYYLDHNGKYYTENKSAYKIDKRGKINWNKTIKSQVPTIQKKSFLYLTHVVRFSITDISCLITQINKFCVYESFKRVGWIFTTYTPERPDIQFDKKLFLSILKTKLNRTNNDEERILFRSMISMIKFYDSKHFDKQFYFGTENFEIIWERLIDKIFGIPNKKKFFPHGLWTERFGKNKSSSASALEPDSIMIYDNKYYILDAKYYKYGIFPNSGSKMLPQSSDINKQITYGRFVKERRTPKGTLVFNAFIIPYNRLHNDFNTNNIFCNVAEGTGDWLINPETYERIQVITLDTRYIIRNIYGNHDLIKKQLVQEIERPFKNKNHLK